MQHKLTRHIPHYALRATAVVLVVLAVVLWALRLALPELVPDYRATLEQRLSEELGQPVEVERLRLDWRGWRPLLHAEGVRVGPEEQALGFRSLRVELALLDSAVNRQVAVQALALEGLRLDAGLDERGKPVVLGLEGLTLAEEAFDLSRLEAFDWSLLPARMRLDDVVVRWHAPDGQVWTVPGAARLQRDARSLQADAVLHPPEALGGRVQGQLKLELPRGDAVPAGRAHLQGQGLVLAAIQGLLPLSDRAYQVQGQGDLALWGEWPADGPLQVIGDFRFVDLDWRRTADGELQPLAGQVSGKGRWSGTPADWRLDVNDLAVERPDQDWAAQDLAFVHRRTEAGGFALQGVFQRAHLDDLARLASLSPGLADDTLARLQAASPYGEFRDTHLRLELDREGGVAQLDAAGSLAGVGLQPVEKLPGVGPLYGEFRTTERGGQAEFRLEDGALDYPYLFPETIPLSQFSTAIRWWVDPDGRYRVDFDDIALRNPDARGEGRLSLAGRPGEPPWMRLQAEARDGDGSQTARYLPIRFLPSGTREWLADAVRQGEVTEAHVHWDGPASGALFRDGQVDFRAGGRVRNGELAYQPDWPVLTGAEAELDFRGASMHIRGHSGQLSGAEVRHVDVTLPDLFEPVLALHGQVRGPGEAYLDYLRDMPLTRELLRETVPMALDGEHDLALGLTLPLRDFEPERVRVDGQLSLEAGSRYRLPRWDLTFDGLAGDLHFDQRGLRTTGLEARYLGHPLVVDAETDDGRIFLRGRGRGAPADLFPQVPIPADWVSGETAWRADLQLPDFRPEQGPEDVLLRLSSGLEGLALHLPEPLGKGERESRNLTVETRMDGDGLAPVRWRYADRLNGVLALEEAEEGSDAFNVPRLAVVFGEAAAELPEQPGWTVSGVVPPLSLAPWLDWLDQQAPAEPGTAALPPLALDLRFQQIDLGELALDNQRVVLEPEPHSGWSVRLDGPLAGEVFWPDAPDTDQPVRVDLDRLDLAPALFTEEREAMAEQPPAEDGDDRLRPGRLPPMALAVDQLVIDRRDLGELSLRVVPEDNSARFRDIRLVAPTFTLDGELAWHFRDGGHRTESQISLEGERAGDILATFGYLPTVSRGRTRIESDVAWDNLPQRFSLAAMEGTVSLRIDDGQIPDLSPGAGRLFGLLSVTTLPRRLALDFSDIFGRGFAFDRLRADLDLADGDAHIQRFDIDGPAAKLALDGRIGLRDRDYDQTVQVTPRLGATMPIVGFIFGGPVGAAAGWLADQVAGDEVERATRYSYRVTGPWDDPVVERRGAE